MKLKVNYENQEIDFSIIRRKRKTICIKIMEDGEVIVSAPLRISKESILLVVKNRAHWIIEKQKEIKLRSSRKIKRIFTDGSTLMYLGKEYPMYIVLEENRRKITVELNGNFEIFTNTMVEEKLRAALEKWYRTETLKIVTKRIENYSNNFTDKVTDVKVKEQKRRWASCTWKNSILFNWRISMARADVIDYIVIHEMCHMDYRNHSKCFWNRVAEIMPDYKEKHEWLKINGMNLYL
ncbi:SprT family zinc-dependent metalloprotease [Clostridium sp.]|uniref:M48 family metallopeptidase n=1 Tax=Clostridium sp. TaxID=1506 RepID=UPI0028505C87|nr:SprT family zinc-dependent metalloprotease [Clostridium sp.]MDR3593601.1 SprT family zinc-dependent metalloprotease [Clostridium sp.]